MPSGVLDSRPYHEAADVDQRSLPQVAAALAPERIAPYLCACNGDLVAEPQARGHLCSHYAIWSLIAEATRHASHDTDRVALSPR